MAAWPIDHECVIESLPGLQVLGTVDREGATRDRVLARGVDVVPKPRPRLRRRCQDIRVSLVVVLREKGAVNGTGWHDHVWHHGFLEGRRIPLIPTHLLHSLVGLLCDTRQCFLREPAVDAGANAQVVQLRGEVREQQWVGGSGEVLELIRVRLHVIELVLAVRVLDMEVLLRL